MRRWWTSPEMHLLICKTTKEKVNSMHIFPVLKTAGTSLDLSIRQAIYTTDAQKHPKKARSKQFLLTLQIAVTLPENKEAQSQKEVPVTLKSCLC